MSNLANFIVIALAAIGIQLVSSAITAFGYALQKQAHIYAHKIRIKPIKTLKWWFGLVAIILGIPLNICKFNF